MHLSYKHNPYEFILLLLFIKYNIILKNKNSMKRAVNLGNEQVLIFVALCALILDIVLACKLH